MSPRTTCRALALPVLRHRILVNFRAEAEGVTVSQDQSITCSRSEHPDGTGPHAVSGSRHSDADSVAGTARPAPWSKATGEVTAPQPVPRVFRSTSAGNTGNLPREMIFSALY